MTATVDTGVVVMGGEGGSEETVDVMMLKVVMSNSVMVVAPSDNSPIPSRFSTSIKLGQLQSELHSISQGASTSCHSSGAPEEERQANVLHNGSVLANLGAETV